MNIGIDLDNTINANDNTISFFALITFAIRKSASNKIYIITNRDKGDYDNTVNELDKLGICYDHLVITSEKEKIILENNISIYFDDTDEYFVNLPESVTVFKIRETGNFDFELSKWVYGEKTGLSIDSA